MKKIFAVLTALLVMLSWVFPVSAADGKVTYSGDAGKFIFQPGSEYSPTDLFADFKDVMPGDTLTQKITVRNDASNNVKVKIYIRSLGAHEDSVDFLSQLKLRVQKSGENGMPYMFDATASEAAQLTDWVCLGTLYSGGEVRLDLILDVPVELDSQYQYTVGYLDWEFKVEEFAVEAGDPTPPQTGDNVNLLLYFALAIGALALLILLLAWRKKGDKQEEDKEA